MIRVQQGVERLAGSTGGARRPGRHGLRIQVTFEEGQLEMIQRVQRYLDCSMSEAIRTLCEWGYETVEAEFGAEED